MPSQTVSNGGTRPGSKLAFDEGFVQIIDGEASPTKQSRHGVNPANLKPKASVPLCTKEDLDRAVEAGKKAFRTWSKVPYEERRKAVLAFGDAVENLRTEFHMLLTSEQGKPVRLLNSGLQCTKLISTCRLPKPRPRPMQRSDGSVAWPIFLSPTTSSKTTRSAKSSRDILPSVWWLPSSRGTFPSCWRLANSPLLS